MKENLFKYIFFGIIVLLICISLYFLYKDTKNKEETIKANKLEIDMIKEINIGISQYDTINPILSYNRDIQYIDKLIFEPLLDISSTFEIENKLAKEFSKVNDTIYIVKLKEDIYWHDGKNFTSEDVIFTLETLKTTNKKSIYKENIKKIKEIKKIDDYTIKIFLEEKVDFFEYNMCIPILAKHGYDNEFNSKTKIPIGTGNFKIKTIENNKIELYKSNNNMEENKINLILKESQNDVYKAITNGEIDLMITENIDYETYIGTIGYNVIKYPNREFDYLILNQENNILNNKQIRKALSYAIDIKKINYDVYKDKYNIACFPLYYGSYLCDLNKKTEYNPEEAKKIFNENGWKTEKGILKKKNKVLRLRLLVKDENKKRIEVANHIKEQLEQLGIKIDIILANENKYYNYIKNRNYDIILEGKIVSNNPDINSFFETNNKAENKTNEILNEIKIVDNQKGMLVDKYKNIQEIYEEETPFISLYFNSLFIITNKNLKGNISGNWYNIYYNIDNWYKVK